MENDAWINGNEKEMEIIGVLGKDFEKARTEKKMKLTDIANIY